MVTDLTEETKKLGVWSSERRQDLDAIKHIVIHRNSVARGVVSIAKWYRDRGYEWTGTQRMPYHFWISPRGNIEQAVPMRIYTPGARGKNKNALHIAVHGDFRGAVPTDQQFRALKNLLVLLKKRFPGAKIVHHNGPKHLIKPCPGRNLNVTRLAAEVKQLVNYETMRALKQKGIV